MAEPGQLIDMQALRSKLLAVQERLRSASVSIIIGTVNGPGLQDLDEARTLLAAAIALLYPQLDADAELPHAIPQGPVAAAINAAHGELLAAGLENPVEILIVQTHDADGHNTGRSLASSAANPQDILRIVLRNLQRHHGAKVS